MKHSLLLSALFFLLVSSYGQGNKPSGFSNIITTKKIILQYEHNQADSLLIPIVSDQYPELKKNIMRYQFIFWRQA